MARRARPPAATWWSGDAATTGVGASSTTSGIARTPRRAGVGTHALGGLARRWFAAREGEGRPWTVGDTAQGPWARWDEHFGSVGEVVEWTEGDGSVTAVIRETNDYYRLLERGAMLNAITYHFDDEGLLEGLVIGSAGERDMGLTEEFRAWAEENHPEEIAELMPEGEIDPRHPERFRRLLEEWRRVTGRGPIE